MHSKVFALMAALAVVTAAPASAHHSFAAEFDGSRQLQLTGHVTKVEWQNPHIWVYLDVKDDQGTPQHWQCEGGAPNTLTRNGWSKETLKIGDEIFIDGFPAKDGSKTCNARVVRLPDGRTVFAGSSNGDTAPKRQ